MEERVDVRNGVKSLQKKLKEGVKFNHRLMNHFDKVTFELGGVEVTTKERHATPSLSDAVYRKVYVNDSRDISEEGIIQIKREFGERIHLLIDVNEDTVNNDALNEMHNFVFSS